MPSPFKKFFGSSRKKNQQENQVKPQPARVPIVNSNANQQQTAGSSTHPNPYIRPPVIPSTTSSVNGLPPHSTLQRPGVLSRRRPPPPPPPPMQQQRRTVSSQSGVGVPRQDKELPPVTSSPPLDTRTQSEPVRSHPATVVGMGVRVGGGGEGSTDTVIRKGDTVQLPDQARGGDPPSHATSNTGLVTLANLVQEASQPPGLELSKRKPVNVNLSDPQDLSSQQPSSFTVNGVTHRNGTIPDSTDSTTTVATCDDIKTLRAELEKLRHRQASMEAELAKASLRNGNSSPPSSDIESIVVAALQAYKEKTGKDLKSHPLFRQLEACDSPSSVLALFQDAQFDQPGTGVPVRVKQCLLRTLDVLSTFSSTVGEGVGLVFPPAKAVFAGVGVLLLAAKDVAASQDIIVDIFGRIESFFFRLEIYTEVPLTPAMTKKMVEITVEILDILATATKEMEQSRGKTFLKRVVGWTDLEDGLKRLDTMIYEEIAMASAQHLQITRRVDNKVTEVNAAVSQVNENVVAVQSGVEVVIEDVRAVSDNVETMAEEGRENANEIRVVLQQATDGVDKIKRNQLLESLRKWQSPPDPSMNHQIAGGRQHNGTTEWFTDGEKCRKWKADGSLLWIHGKPGSGKSVLCSAIINNVAMLCEAGLAAMAYFYFDFRDVDKQSRRKLLPSLLIQLATRSDAFCDILSRLYEAYDNGAHRPNDKALMQCLQEMLTLPNQGPVYIILDALDECPDTSDVPSPRELVLDLVKHLVGLELPNLRICITSRLEVDIGAALEPLASQTVSLQDEGGQKEDIAAYVRSVVYSGSGKFMRLRDEDKEHVIKTLSEKADGMFRWVFCQLETLRNCMPQNIRTILNQLPNSLDETYERMLREILAVNPGQAYRLLQCLTVATRPLRVDELAEILALDFDGPGAEQGVPVLNKDWRSDDKQQAVLSMCSSLIVVVDGYFGTRLVQFAHFSVKEFLTSNRLSNVISDISRFHIRFEQAHTVISQACLAILLQTNCDDQAESASPLSRYASWNWVHHAQFGNVGSHVDDGMRRLFDPDMPYFAAWRKLCDLDRTWRSFPQVDRIDAPASEPASSGKANAPLCIYYAALCGFRDLTKYLVGKYPQHVNARVGLNKSPLVAALCNKHIRVATLLRQQGAVLQTSYGGRTLLHAASKDGMLDVAQWLLNSGEDANAQQDDHRTPLHLAAGNGHLEVVQLLLSHNAGINVAAGWENRTPMHEALLGGHVGVMRLLIQNGADASKDLQGLLRSASLLKDLNVDIVRLCISLGVDVNAQDGSHESPLHLAASAGNTETVQLLIRHGVDVNTRDASDKTPLHLALSKEHDKTVQMLIANGADVNARDGDRSTPLHMALLKGDIETVKLLIKHGANVDTLDGDRMTPLHRVSSQKNAEAVLTLIQNGANVNARDGSYSTPLHLAALKGNDEIVRLLIKHGADVRARDLDVSTPLHKAASLSSWVSASATVRVLIEQGSDVNASDKNRKTPLHLISSSWSPNGVSLRLLLENGADADLKDDKGLTPHEVASKDGNRDIAQFLVNYRKKRVARRIRS